MAGTVRFAPAHHREPPSRFRDVREHHHEQADGTGQSENSRGVSGPPRRRSRADEQHADGDGQNECPSQRGVHRVRRSSHGASDAAIEAWIWTHGATRRTWPRPCVMCRLKIICLMDPGSVAGARRRSGAKLKAGASGFVEPRRRAQVGRGQRRLGDGLLVWTISKGCSFFG